MNELLIAFLILLISFAMFFAILIILKADKKILEINDKVTEIKNINFDKLKQFVSIFNKINKTLHFGKIKRIIEIVMTTISITNFCLFCKKYFSKSSN